MSCVVFQVAHFNTPFAYHCLDSFHSAINGLLPPDIRVREVSAACPEFHARTSSKSKIYHYKIYNGAVMDPFHNNYAYHSAHKLNPHAMREAAKHFIGVHDFTSFANAVHNDRVRSPIKKISRFDVTEMVTDDPITQFNFLQPLQAQRCVWPDIFWLLNRMLSYNSRLKALGFCTDKWGTW